MEINLLDLIAFGNTRLKPALFTCGTIHFSVHAMLSSLQNGQIQMSEGKGSIWGQGRIRVREITLADVYDLKTDCGLLRSLPELNFRSSKNLFVKLGILYPIH